MIIGLTCNLKVIFVTRTSEEVLETSLKGYNKDQYHLTNHVKFNISFTLYGNTFIYNA